MSDASVVEGPVKHLSGQKPRLRSDLRRISVAGRKRTYAMIVDEVSGRFARVSEHLWGSLQQGDDDPQLWQEARAAGWTRERLGSRGRRFSPLFFRIPLGSVDWLAKRLARASGVLFSSTAILVWSLLILAASLIAISRSSEIFASLGSLRLFLEQANPVWIFAIFVLTKIVHELAHAVMCRRMGGRCGTIGLLMMCGIPCPYCDVTDVWRQPSPAARGAVMFAGIYVELIIASLATFVWLAATDPAVQLGAMNLMVVCGISTIVFNANPLMRYDGYYVLSDLMGSTNLRREASVAFRNVCTRRIAGAGYQSGLRSDRRSVLLSIYHLASKIYRVVISVAIVAFVISVADYWNLRSLAIASILFTAGMVLRRSASRIAKVVRGGGNWERVGFPRRVIVAATLLGLVVVGLWLPTPRFRHASGWVDAADTTTVFVSGAGMIESVSADFGQRVEQGATLTQIRDETIQFEQTELRGRLRIARLRRSNLARRVSLDRPELADQWQTLEAAEDAVAMRLASIEKQVADMLLVAPIAGVVLPPEAAIAVTDSGSMHSLRDRIGSVTSQRESWCRISPDGQLHVVLVIDARDRSEVVQGAAVQISLGDAPENVFSSTVASVSAIQGDQPSVTRQAAYHVLCPLPAAADRQLLSWLGKPCRGVFHLPRRSLAEDLRQWLGEWFRG